MALSRYEIIDPYTLEELRREYQNSSARSRISLLRKLCKNGSLPYEIAALAVEDQNVQVRQWFARHCPHLDYRESCLVDNQLTTLPSGIFAGLANLQILQVLYVTSHIA